MTDWATVLNVPLLLVPLCALPWQQRTVTVSWTHHQQVRWWGSPCPLASSTCVCVGGGGGAVASSACSPWSCGNPRPGLHCWSGGAPLHSSSPSSQGGEESEPWYASGNFSLSHPDRRISAGLLSGWKTCSLGSGERRWGTKWAQSG